MRRAIRSSLIRATRFPAFGAVVALLERMGDRRPNLLRVLTWHRIDLPQAKPHLWAGLISASPEGFRRQVEYLAAAYRVVSPADVLAAVEGRASLPARALLLTFDDGYRDFAENAWPVLRRLSLPALLFVPTAFPGEPKRTFWWDRLHRAVGNGRAQEMRRIVDELKQLPHDEAARKIEAICGDGGVKDAGSVLSWPELRQLSAEGLTLAPHTRTHPLLCRVSPEQVHREIAGSWQDLRRECHSAFPALAYPGGSFNADVVRATREAGLRLGFTTARGMNELSSADPLRLRRINVGADTPQALLRAQMLPQVRYFGRRPPVGEAVGGNHPAGRHTGSALPLAERPVGREPLSEPVAS